MNKGDVERSSPLGRDPGDRVGLALDVDGTVYRDGSVFVEALAFLPFAGGELALRPADRERLREALLAVAEYGAGTQGRRRWGRLLRGVDAVQTVAGDDLAARTLDALVRLRGTERTDATDRTGYDGMRATVLGAYGEVIEGRERAVVERATAELLDRAAVDRSLRAVLARASAAGAETVLVSDAPDHLVGAYAERLGVTGAVGTRYPTDRGRFTGEYDLVDKRAAVERLRADRGWDWVLCAGDSAVDTRMATAAECFLAVDGQGDVRSAFEDLAPVDMAPPAALRRRLGGDRGAVHVGRDDEFWEALLAVLRAADVL